MTYEVQKVDASTYKIVDASNQTEVAVCFSYNGETLPAQKRAYMICKALSVAHCPAKKKGRT